MNVRPLFDGRAWVLEQRRFHDERGWFQEWFKHSTVSAAVGFDFVPVQANISRSSAGVVRGVHFSVAPRGQSKLVTVMAGRIADYVVDIDPMSTTFGRWERVRLSADSACAVLLSPHMGHAFQSLENDTVVSYLVTAEFDPDNEKAVTPLCPHLSIEWEPGLTPVVSDKDRAAPDLFAQRESGNLPNPRAHLGS